MASSRLTLAKQRAGQLARANAQRLVKTFAPRTIAKGQAKAEAKVNAQRKRRRVAYALKNAERQQARAKAKAQARLVDARMAAAEQNSRRTTARRFHAEQVAGAATNAESKEIVRAREHYKWQMDGFDNCVGQRCVTPGHINVDCGYTLRDRPRNRPTPPGDT